MKERVKPPGWAQFLSSRSHWQGQAEQSPDTSCRPRAHSPRVTTSCRSHATDHGHRAWPRSLQRAGHVWLGSALRACAPSTSGSLPSSSRWLRAFLLLAFTISYFLSLSSWVRDCSHRLVLLSLHLRRVPCTLFGRKQTAVTCTEGNRAGSRVTRCDKTHINPHVKLSTVSWFSTNLSSPPPEMPCQTPLTCLCS